VIKRIAILFALTGAAYGFSVIALKYLAAQAEVSQVAKIAELDSLIQFLIGLIGFGMQTEAIRNISFSLDWRKDLVEAQSARETMAILLLVLVLFGVLKEYYFYFAMAPLLAASADYALYARGLATFGAFTAFLRVVFPLGITLIATVYFPGHVFSVYALATAVVYLMSNWLIYFWLGVPFQYRINFKSLQLYLKTVPIGIINLAFYFFGLGILMLAQPFFTPDQFVVSFVALKFYLIFKGGIRVIQQGFVNRMNEEAVCVRIDKIAMMLAIMFFGTLAVFPRTIIPLVFGDRFFDHPILFAGLGLAAVVFSIFCSSYTRVLLERKDVALMKLAVIAVAISATTFLILFQIIKEPEVVVAALLIGELSFSLSLATNFFSREQIKQRMTFLIVVFLGLLLPISFRLFWGDFFAVYFASFAVLGVVLFVFNRKNLVLPNPVSE
jgi:hypothetical protein